MDREDDDAEPGEGGRGDLEYPRAGAAFSGAAAEDAAVLAARASAIVDKGVTAQKGRPTAGRSAAADNGSKPLEIIAPGSQGGTQGSLLCLCSGGFYVLHASRAHWLVVDRFW